MTFKDSIVTCISKYATFKGRAPLSEYWWFILFEVLAVDVVMLIFGGIGYAVGDVYGAYIAAVLGGSLCSLLLFLPALAVTIRRLHDSGKSGWWYFIVLVPFVGSIWLLVLLLLRSDDENAYGLPVY